MCRSEVEKVEKSLRLFSDTLDEWLECQKQWLYLETIFSAADIQRQLPAEAKAFVQVRDRGTETAGGQANSPYRFGRGLIAKTYVQVEGGVSASTLALLSG